MIWPESGEWRWLSVRIISRPAGVWNPGGGRAPVRPDAPRSVRGADAEWDSDECPESPARKLMEVLIKGFDSNGILVGKSLQDLASEAGIPLRLARIEMGCLVASQKLMVFSSLSGPVWVLPDVEDNLAGDF